MSTPSTGSSTSSTFPLMMVTTGGTTQLNVSTYNGPIECFFFFRRAVTHHHPACWPSQSSPRSQRCCCTQSVETNRDKVNLSSVMLTIIWIRDSESESIRINEDVLDGFRRRDSIYSPLLEQNSNNQSIFWPVPCVAKKAKLKWTCEWTTICHHVFCVHVYINKNLCH